MKKQKTVGFNTENGNRDAIQKQQKIALKQTKKVKIAHGPPLKQGQASPPSRPLPPSLGRERGARASGSACKVAADTAAATLRFHSLYVSDLRIARVTRGTVLRMTGVTGKTVADDRGYRENGLRMTGVTRENGRG